MTLATTLLLAAFAAEPPAVAVLAPAAGTAARARGEVEEALRGRDDLRVVPVDRWRAAAREAGVPAGAAAAPASVARVAPGAGASGAVLLSLQRRGAARLVRARLVDAGGRPLWTGTYEAVAGGLGAANARDVATSVAAALAPPAAAPTPPPAAPTAEAPAAPEAPEPAPPQLPPAVPEPPAPAERTTADASAEQSREVAEAFAREESALRLELGVPFTWRSADILPANAVPIQYRTGSPYLGLVLDVRAAPFRSWWTNAAPPWAEPLQVEAYFSQRFLSSNVPDQTTGVAASVSSREQRFGLDLRYPFLLPTRTRVAGRLGWAWHRFNIDENPLIASSRRNGVRLGADVEHPFLRWVTGELQLRWYPAMAPGAEERAKLSASDSSGSGYELAVGASGPLPQLYAGLGWRVAYDLLHFSDSFPVNAAANASATASYHSVTISVTYTR
jgi:hypothetical protein